MLLPSISAFIFHLGSISARSLADLTLPRHHSIPHAASQTEALKHNATHDKGNYRFYNNATAPHLVNALPSIDFPVGELYSGLVPINRNDTSRQLFYVFKPRTGPPVDEVTIWLNGGPGCSSLTGFLQENGPWLWQPGTDPFLNAYSWADETNMLWVDQPIGTGFSIGRITATSEEDIAADFVKFFRNWQDIFGIRNFKIYITGESYAGRYVPYISAAMLDQNDTTCYDLRGAMMFDPTIGQYTRDSYEVPIYPFVQANNNLLNLNASMLSLLASLHETCGYADYSSRFLQFPPRGLQPSNVFNIVDNPRCWMQRYVVDSMYAVNPCFSVYNIALQCPVLANVLPLETFPGDKEPYFNRADVKKALHAPLHVQWSVCASRDVFAPSTNRTDRGPELNYDLSPDPIQHVLPQVIEATGRVLIANGDWDFLFPTNGTLLAIQNMTWNGLLGFQAPPSTPVVIDMVDQQYKSLFAHEGLSGADAAQGTMGTQHFERGLMWAETFQCGHMQPQWQPRVALRYLQWLLGRVETL